MPQLFEDPNLAPDQSGLSLAPGQDVPGVGMDAEMPRGLISEPPGTPGIGLDVPAKQSPRDAVREKFASLGTVGKIGAALSEFGAGVQGRPSPLQAQVAEEHKNRLLENADKREGARDFASYAAIVAKADPENREALAETLSKQLGGPLGESLKTLAKHPDATPMVNEIAKYKQYLPLPMQVELAKDPHAFFSNLAKPQYMKAVEDARNRDLEISGDKNATLLQGSIGAHPEALIAAGVPQEAIDAYKKTPSASTLIAINNALPDSSPSKMTPDQINHLRKDDSFWQIHGMRSPKDEGEITRKGAEGQPVTVIYEPGPDGKIIAKDARTGRKLSDNALTPGSATQRSNELPPLQGADLTSAGAQHATGQPLMQVVPGYGRNITERRESVRKEAMAQIKAQNPDMTDAQVGQELANRGIDFAGAKRSVTQLNTMLGATRQAVDQLDFNVKKVTENMDKLPSSDISPVINAIARQEQKWTGDPAYSSIFYYMHAAAMESARILQGGQASIAQLHQGAADEAKKWADANFTTPKAWKEGVAPAMQAEGAERIKTYERAIAKQRPGGGQSDYPDTKEAYQAKFGKAPPSIGNAAGFDALKKGDGYIDSRDGRFKVKG